MKHIFLLVTLAVATTSVAQISFVKGYFIDNSQKRVDCLIRNIQWNDTPAEFEYKLSDNAQIETKKDYEVSEFGFGTTKYISAKVEMDVSSDKIEQLTLEKNPEFTSVRIFMKLLSDGKGKLYHYGKNDLQRYFYSVDDGKIKQLVYRRYYADLKKEDMAKNYLFRQQLWTDVKCNSTNMSDVEKLSYTKSDLTKYFEAVNKCNGSAVTETVATKSAGTINLKASVILGQHSFGFESPAAGHDFDSKTFVAFGAEFEWIVPFWNNKWGLIVEPSYSSYESESQENGDEYSVQFKYIRIAAGFRHYFFLSDKSKMFLNVVVNYNKLSSDSHLKFDVGNIDYPTLDFVGGGITTAIGAGFNFRKIHAELRYYPKSDPSPYIGTTYSYNKSEVILRYQFL